MAYVSVPKDLTVVKNKVAFNLTKRQLICLAIGGAVGVPAYFLLRGHIRTDLAALIMVALMLPFFAFAIYEKNGQTLEKVIKNWFNLRFLSSLIRPYRTENLYHVLEENRRTKEVIQKAYGNFKLPQKHNPQSRKAGKAYPKKAKKRG